MLTLLIYCGKTNTPTVALLEASREVGLEVNTINLHCYHNVKDIS